MASNRIPGSRSGLKASCSLLIEGCEALQNPIGLMHTTDTVLQAALTNFEQKETQALAARLKRSVSEKDVKALDMQASALLAKVSRSLRNVLSPRYSTLWQETKWPGNTVSVPATRDERFILLQSLSVFYSTHADYEVTKQGLTAAACEALHEQIKTARAVLSTDEADAATKNLALETAEQQLRLKVADLISELSRLIAGDDPRWRRFGLNLPDAPEVTDVPENVAVNASIPGKLLVSCEGVTGATYYRFWKQMPGVDAEPVFVGSAQEPQFLLEGLTPGVATKVFVSAVNANGAECRLSEPAEGTPVALAA